MKKHSEAFVDAFEPDEEYNMTSISKHTIFFGSLVIISFIIVTYSLVCSST